MKKLVILSVLILMISLLAGAASAADPEWTQEIEDQSVTVGYTLSFTLQATDADAGDTVTYSAEVIPAGATLNPNTGEFSWIPRENQIGNILSIFVATSSNGGDQPAVQDVTLTVLPLFELQPVGDVTVDAFSAIPNIDMKDYFNYNGANSLSYTLSALNNNNLLTCPQDCPRIDSSGIVTWTPQKDSIGAPNNNFRIRVTAAETSGSRASRNIEFNIKVNPVLRFANQNFPASLKADGINDGKYEYAPVVEFSGKTADLEYLMPFVDGVNIQPAWANGKITWTPAQADKGAKTLTLEVRDRRQNGAGPIAKIFPVEVEGAKFELVQGTILPLGGENEERRNPDADADGELNKKFTNNLVVRNTGDVKGKLGSVQLDLTYGNSKGPLQKDATGDNFITSDGIDGYNIVIGQTQNIEINPGAEASIGVSAKAAKDFPAVDEKEFTPKAFRIGKIQITTAEGVFAADNANAASVYITMQVENKLEIKSFKICPQGEECSKDYDDGDVVEDLKPGDLLDLSVEIENTYDGTDFDFSIEDEAEIEFDSDDESVIDTPSNEDFSIAADEKDTVELDAEIEEDANGKTTLTIMAHGKDDNGALHGMVWTIDIDVKRDTHEIIIKDATLVPNFVACGGSDAVQVSVDISNIGKRKEKEAKVELKVNKNDLNIQDSKNDLELDADDSYTAIFAFNLPSGLAADTYPIEINTYYKPGQLSHTKTLLLTVPNCGQEEEQPEEEEKKEETKGTEVVVTTGTAGTSTATGTAATATPIVSKAARTSFRNSTTYVALLVGVIVVLLILGGILVALIMKKN